MAVVEYETENLDPPILTVEDAVNKSNIFEVPPILSPKNVGDFSKGMAEAEHNILSAKLRLGSQYFYMERQTSLAIPDEDNCMLIYSSSQWPESAQSVIASCLGVSEHNIRVITRRVGGGFAGKAIRAMPVSTACALAAHKLRRPVRIYLDRKTSYESNLQCWIHVKWKDNSFTPRYTDKCRGITADISPIIPQHDRIEGAFVQGVRFFMLKEYLTDEDGLVVSDSTWTYKILTIDTIPEQFNVNVLNTGHHQNCILSSKASGEPPLLLAASVHCATRAAIKAARKQLEIWGKLDGVDSDFNLEVPAVLPVVKTHCGLDYDQKFLEFLLGHYYSSILHQFII